LPQKKLLVNVASYLLPPVFLFVANFCTLAINKKGQCHGYKGSFWEKNIHNFFCQNRAQFISFSSFLFEPLAKFG